MGSKQKIREIVSNSIEYECPVCQKKYGSIEEAERCAAPREPKYKVGELVMTNKHITRAVPGGDEFYREYDEISKGSFARISKISDENERWGANEPHPDYVYGFDMGEIPLRYYHTRESSLEKISGSALEKLKERHESASAEAADIETILNEIE